MKIVPSKNFIQYYPYITVHTPITMNIKTSIICQNIPYINQSLSQPLNKLGRSNFISIAFFISRPFEIAFCSKRWVDIYKLHLSFDFILYQQICVLVASLQKLQIVPLDNNILPV